MNMGILIPLLGIINLLLVFLQLSTGLRWIKVSFGFHKRTGIILLVLAIFHGSLAAIFR